MYEQLRGREDITPLQYRLMLLVQLKKQRIRMREVELMAFAGLNEHTKKPVIATLESYQRLVFSGLGSSAEKEESFEDLAKRKLAEEAKKVYIVKQRGGGINKVFEDAAKSSDPNVRALAARELREHMKKKARALNKKRERKGKKLPRGTTTHKG